MIHLPHHLVAGFRRFREQYFDNSNKLFPRLVERGQRPRVLIVACCDSRVDPALIFDCDPGDLFVVRNVANLVPPLEEKIGLHGTTAAIEYGVDTLSVGHIIVLGHTHCGGIHALVEAGGVGTANSYIGDWMALAESARASVIAEMPDACQEEKEYACEQRAILLSLGNLMTFPWVKERVENGTLTLHGWHFDMGRGKLLHYDENSEQFIEF